MIKRGNLTETAPPPSEVVNVPEEPFKDDVEIRGVMLNEKLHINAIAHQDSGRVDIAQLLAYSVYDVEGERVWSKQQWQAWGGQNQAAAVRLAIVAMKLGGFLQEEIEKKPEAPSANL